MIEKNEQVGDMSENSDLDSANLCARTNSIVVPSIFCKNNNSGNGGDNGSNGALLVFAFVVLAIVAAEWYSDAPTNGSTVQTSESYNNFGKKLRTFYINNVKMKTKKP